jgi:hypothetical protein
MPWPIPEFPKIEYPKPISWRLWLPVLAVIAVGAAGAVLMLWPHGKPTNTLLFRVTLFGAPLVACALTFAFRLDPWEEQQTDAEESESEQHRLRDGWREWTRRRLHVVDIAVFLGATKDVAKLAKPNVDLPSQTDRAVGFEVAKRRTDAFRRMRLLHLVVMHFADALRAQREVMVTIMLDEASPERAQAWTKRARFVFRRLIPGVTFRFEVRLATGGVQWITELVDTVDPTTRLVIAAQLWGGKDQEHTFSEGVAAFLIEPDASHAGSIFRPMTSTRDTLEKGLAQIKDYQASPERPALAWFAACEEKESTAIRSAVTSDPKDSTVERLLDQSLGLPGPASGWIALAIAMEAVRGAGPQLVAWREPESELLNLCMISPPPHKETTV